ncbi:hypothetical protein TpMuguga_02g00904 [Theileria parva strain Muguga]|uniref:Uncharacterized protein n=1 Tax=Theileria parva TaxID=5875 RepID=Q4N3T4_THEPA|nr:uncharacterized protein TpMuguga_02g00904 [Theileria parva strain Muguga]EAN33189.1 hypothetical protein TpMuguga_02g00904 [Theileria parva strain Muguga]|eukprot:XP_765472.1 hypothetical protein [Theileria parva strain Muguga]
MHVVHSNGSSGVLGKIDVKFNGCLTCFLARESRIFFFRNLWLVYIELKKVDNFKCQQVWSMMAQKKSETKY